MNKKEKSEKVLTIIGDIKNSSNKDLMLAMDTIQEDFEFTKKIVIDSLSLQAEAIKEYGSDYLNNDKFFKNVINDHKYIKEFNQILKKYLDDQIYVEYIARKKDNSGNYVIDKLIIELKPIEKKHK
jgi:hypothetical protein